MKKDIKIPEVKRVSMAAVYEYSPNFTTREWNVYLINEGDLSLDMVLVVSKGSDSGSDRKTSVIRRKINSLPPRSFAKIEFLPEELLEFDNLFQVSYFQDNKMFERDFLFKGNTVAVEHLTELPLVDKKGILAP
jgi:hypothetical protein